MITSIVILILCLNSFAFGGEYDNHPGFKLLKNQLDMERIKQSSLDKQLLEKIKLIRKAKNREAVNKYLKNIGKTMKTPPSKLSPYAEKVTKLALYLDKLRNERKKLTSNLDNRNMHTRPKIDLEKLYNQQIMANSTIDDTKNVIISKEVTESKPTTRYTGQPFVEYGKDIKLAIEEESILKSTSLTPEPVHPEMKLIANEEENKKFQLQEIIQQPNEDAAFKVKEAVKINEPSQKLEQPYVQITKEEIKIKIPQKLLEAPAQEIVKAKFDLVESKLPTNLQPPHLSEITNKVPNEIVTVLQPPLMNDNIITKDESKQFQLQNIIEPHSPPLKVLGSPHSEEMTSSKSENVKIFLQTQNSFAAEAKGGEINGFTEVYQYSDNENFTTITTDPDIKNSLKSQQKQQVLEESRNTFIPYKTIELPEILFKPNTHQRTQSKGHKVIVDKVQNLSTMTISEQIDHQLDEIAQSLYTRKTKIETKEEKSLRQPTRTLKQIFIKTATRIPEGRFRQPKKITKLANASGLRQPIRVSHQPRIKVLTNTFLEPNYSHKIRKENEKESKTFKGSEERNIRQPYERRGGNLIYSNDSGQKRYQNIEHQKKGFRHNYKKIGSKEGDMKDSKIRLYRAKHRGSELDSKTEKLFKLSGTNSKEFKEKIMKFLRTSDSDLKRSEEIVVKNKQESRESKNKKENQIRQPMENYFRAKKLKIVHKPKSREIPENQQYNITEAKEREYHGRYKEHLHDIKTTEKVKQHLKFNKEKDGRDQADENFHHKKSNENYSKYGREMKLSSEREKHSRENRYQGFRKYFRKYRDDKMSRPLKGKYSQDQDGTSRYIKSEEFYSRDRKDKKLHQKTTNSRDRERHHSEEQYEEKLRYPNQYMRSDQQSKESYFTKKRYYKEYESKISGGKTIQHSKSDEYPLIKSDDSNDEKYMMRKEIDSMKIENYNRKKFKKFSYVQNNKKYYQRSKSDESNSRHSRRGTFLNNNKENMSIQDIKNTRNRKTRIRKVRNRDSNEVIDRYSSEKYLRKDRDAYRSKKISTKLPFNKKERNLRQTTKQSELPKYNEVLSEETTQAATTQHGSNNSQSTKNKIQLQSYIDSESDGLTSKSISEESPDLPLEIHNRLETRTAPEQTKQTTQQLFINLTRHYNFNQLQMEQKFASLDSPTNSPEKPLNVVDQNERVTYLNARRPYKRSNVEAEGIKDNENRGHQIQFKNLVENLHGHDRNSDSGKEIQIHNKPAETNALDTQQTTNAMDDATYVNVLEEESPLNGVKDFFSHVMYLLTDKVWNLRVPRRLRRKERTQTILSPVETSPTGPLPDIQNFWNGLN